MDVTPKLLRDVEFREQRRGYDQKEVDDFLERVAVAFGQLRDQLDEALERATRAERRVLEEPADAEELRRTLVLASRTAEAAQEEARERAAATVEDAEARADATLRQAEAQAAAMVADAEARVRDELEPLLRQRADLEHDVEALQGWSVEARRRLTDDVRRQLAWLEGDGPALPPAPELRTEAVAVPGADEAAPDGGGSGPYAVADGWDPSPPDVRVGEAPPDGDATATFDTLGASGGPEPAAATAVPVHAAGPVAPDRADDGDDPFLAELRRAVDDDQPLGPRDGGADEPTGSQPSGAASESTTSDEDGGPVGGDAEGSSSWFRRQR